MAYELKDLSRDCRAALERGAPAALDEVREAVGRLLANASFVERTCGDAAPTGLFLLYEDPALGFQVLAHVNEKPRISPPHNHGSSWAVYGQARSYTDMTEYERTDDLQDPERASLAVKRKYRLDVGEVGIYPPGVIHSIDYPARSSFIRITGTNLDRIERDAFDLSTGAIRRAAAQQAS